MGIFSNLSGGKTRRAARESQAIANRELEQGNTEASRILSNVGDEQIQILQDGYDDARGIISDGYDDARGIADEGFVNARGDLNDGIDRAIAAEREFLERAEQYTNPFVQAGNVAQERFADLSGQNGEDAQREAIDGYVYSPATELRQKEVQRLLNARGQSSGGRAHLAAARIAEEDFDKTLTRLEGAAARGQQVSQFASGQTSNTGHRVAGFEAGRGSGLAELTRDNTNKLINLATGEASQLGGLKVDEGVSVAGVKGNTSNQLANLALGLSQQRANNAINTGNVVGQSYNTGMNNLLGLVGGAARVAPAVNGIPTQAPK